MHGDWPLYVGEAPSDADITLSEEHDAYRWMSIDDAVALCLPTFVGDGLRAAAALIA